MRYLPPLLPVAVQLPLPFAPETSFDARILPMAWNSRRTRPVLDALRRLVVGDALVCGRWRVEYVALCQGGCKQVRLYRGDRIIGLTLVQDDNPAPVKHDLEALLPTRGTGWRLETDGAQGRRRTRRAPSRIGDVCDVWRWN